MYQISTFKTITSDTELVDLNHHFRVVAGPGAGKTHWLINHIKNVLKNSTKLNHTSKIACISYTNVASKEIIKRLDITNDSVEVSTIHSFLYKNIVKPYVYLLKDEDGQYLINLDELDGHDEHRPSLSKIKHWIENVPGTGRYKYLIYKKETNDCLSDLTWKLDSGGQCKLNLQNAWKASKAKFPKLLLTNIESYKKLYWKNGQIHHEDVLYLAYRILKEYPLIKEFITSRFPYIFLDEFQDTNPIQTLIVKWLANEGSVIGIIGDPAQSIYKFQGASRKDFLEFYLDGQVDYKIEGNRRSTKKITNLLNYMRKGDFEQKCLRNDEGADVYLMVDQTKRDTISYYKKLYGKQKLDSDYCILAVKNKCVAELKSERENYIDMVWENIRDADIDREKFFRSLFLAQEYAYQLEYEIAIKEILKILKVNKNGEFKEPLKGTLKSELIKRSIAVSMIEYLINNREAFLKLSLLQIYQEVNKFLSDNFHISLSNVRGGKFKNISELTIVNDLINNLKLAEDKDTIRTVHKSKGAEFKSVLLYLDDANDLKHILNPDINATEDSCRLLYVALSRAKDSLFIYAPSITSEMRVILEKLNIKIATLSSIKS